MGHPLRLRDGSVALLELRPGTKLTAEEEEALREYVEFLRDKSDTPSGKQKPPAAAKLASAGAQSARLPKPVPTVRRRA